MNIWGKKIFYRRIITIETTCWNHVLMGLQICFDPKSYTFQFLKWALYRRKKIIFEGALIIHKYLTTQCGQNAPTFTFSRIFLFIRDSNFVEIQRLTMWDVGQVCSKFGQSILSKGSHKIEPLTFWSLFNV